MTCQATIPRIHLCAHTRVPCIIKGMNPTSQKRACTGTPGWKDCAPILPWADPGAGTSGVLPGAFTPRPTTLDQQLGPIITGLRPCPPAHSQSQTIHPGPVLSIWPLAPPPLRSSIPRSWQKGLALLVLSWISLDLNQCSSFCSLCFWLPLRTSCLGA